MAKQEDVYTLTGLYQLRNFKMRDQLIKALLAHAQGDIAKHRANVEVYLANPAGIGEHSNIVDAIEYQDQIDVINKYFKKNQEQLNS